MVAARMTVRLVLTVALCGAGCGAESASGNSPAAAGGGGSGGRTGTGGGTTGSGGATGGTSAGSTGATGGGVSTGGSLPSADGAGDMTSGGGAGTCEVFCPLVANSGCDHAGELDACLSGCRADLEGSCASTLQPVLDCATARPAPACSILGIVYFPDCQSEQEAYFACTDG
jgi:hypothetical protein